MKVNEQLNITMSKLRSYLLKALLEGGNYTIAIDISHSKILTLYSVKKKNGEVDAIGL